MELPDEAVTYNYQPLLIPLGEEWTVAAEMRSQQFLHPAKLKDLAPRLTQAKSQAVADREARSPTAEALSEGGGFIDVPQNTLDNYRRKGEASELGRVLAYAAYLRENADRVILLGAGGAHLAARVLFEALKSSYHNELPIETRLGIPRLYFEGDNFDNDSLQDLLDLIQVSCVDPDNREERWAVVVMGKTLPMETAAALRVIRRDAVEYYGLRSEWLQHLIVPISGTSGALHEMFRAAGHEDQLAIPDNVSPRFTAFTPAGLLPAAIMGLDVRALLQGAAAMTRRFLEEPFERNPVLQFAAVNYLMYEELGKTCRVLSVWSRKLQSLGVWYDQLVAESLGKQGRGPTPLTLTPTRDLHTRGQHLQEGPRDRVINHLVVRIPRSAPIGVQMADRNEDELNAFARRTLPDLMGSAHKGVTKAQYEAARPGADLVVPTLSEHTLGQLLQMLMLATVVEGRLMGVNPYSQSGADTYRPHMLDALRATPDPAATPLRQ